jgi:dolichyl-phosphate beta-glucosyltransferase
MREAHGSCCLFTDADLPYGLEAITHMESLVNRREFHLVIGDRSLGSSEYEKGVSLFRRAFSWLSRHFIRVFVIAGIPDSQCGIKAFRGDVAKELFSLIQERRFAADVELLYIALKYNLEIKRIPVQIERNAPSSVRVWKDTARMLVRLARLRSSWRRGVYRSEVLEEISARSCRAGGR